jgi:hypothetical protein
MSANPPAETEGLKIVDIYDLESAMLKDNSRYRHLHGQERRDAILLELLKAVVVQGLTQELWDGLSQVTRDDLTRRFVVNC